LKMFVGVLWRLFSLQAADVVTLLRLTGLPADESGGVASDDLFRDKIRAYSLSRDSPEIPDLPSPAGTAGDGDTFSSSFDGLSAIAAGGGRLVDSGGISTGVDERCGANSGGANSGGGKAESTKASVVDAVQVDVAAKAKAVEVEEELASWRESRMSANVVAVAASNRVTQENVGVETFVGGVADYKAVHAANELDVPFSAAETERTARSAAKVMARVQTPEEIALVQVEAAAASEEVGCTTNLEDKKCVVLNAAAAATAFSPPSRTPSTRMKSLPKSSAPGTRRRRKSLPIPGERNLPTPPDLSAKSTPPTLP
jgi:hypothetical protein